MTVTGATAAEDLQKTKTGIGGVRDALLLQTTTGDAVPIARTETLHFLPGGTIDDTAPSLRGERADATVRSLPEKTADGIATETTHLGQGGHRIRQQMSIDDEKELNFIAAVTGQPTPRTVLIKIFSHKPVYTQVPPSSTNRFLLFHHQKTTLPMQAEPVVETLKVEHGEILDMLTSLERDLDETLAWPITRSLRRPLKGVFSPSRQIFMPTQSRLARKEA